MKFTKHNCLAANAPAGRCVNVLPTVHRAPQSRVTRLGLINRQDWIKSSSLPPIAEVLALRPENTALWKFWSEF